MHIQLSAQVLNQAELLRQIHGLTGAQAAKAYAKALNDTGFEIRRAMQDEMRAVFDRPTDYILRSPRVRMAAPAFAVPDWINRTHWDAWHSCAKRKKATDAQKQMAVDKLDAWRREGVDHAAALESAAIAGWQGLFKPDAAPEAGRQPANTHKHAGAAAAIFDGVWE